MSTSIRIAGQALLCLWIGWGTAIADDTGTVVWGKAIPELEKIRKLQDRHDQLPRWALFRTDRSDNREKISELLDEVVDILGISPAAGMRSNLEAQQFTLQAADMYREYLEQQQQGLRDAREKLTGNLSVAENTYETVKISGDLLRVLRASDELFDLQVPELQPFENMELKREFEKLTTQLRQEG